MKYATDRHYSDPEKAARRLLEYAQAFEPIQEAQSISRSSGSLPQSHAREYAAALDYAILKGWLQIHESGTFLKFTPAGADLFA